MAAANYETALKCVKAALDRINKTRDFHEAAETDPRANRDTRDVARVAASAALQEFAWQAGNVDLIIREKNL